MSASTKVQEQMSEVEVGVLLLFALEAGRNNEIVIYRRFAVLQFAGPSGPHLDTKQAQFIHSASCMCLC